MTITLPAGQPNHRFMRYVRPPTKDDANHSPLYPLRPATRSLQLGIDVETVPEPDGLLAGYLGRDEIDVQLFVQDGVDVPAAWTAALPNATVVRHAFAGVPAAWPMMAAISVGYYAEGANGHAGGEAKFIPGYQLADQQASPANAAPLTTGQRHRIAALTAVAAELDVDAVVTAAPNADRADVADNDIVANIAPNDAVALIGHYLRMTSNLVVDVQRGALAGDAGSWQTTTSTGTAENLYDWGILSQMSFFQIFEIIAVHQADDATVTALKSIRVRLARAARALDHLLALLSNPLNGQRKSDVVEAVAEAFDRELLYLAAAFDIYGRRYPILVDPTRNPKNYRFSMDGQGYIRDHVEKEYDAGHLADVQRLHVYATVCKVIRNHIHDGILPVNQHPGRSHGSTMNIALNLNAMPELLPGSTEVDARLEQAHYDALGAWEVDSTDVSGSPAKVADLATAGVTLLSAGLGLIEAFTKLILTNTPKTATAPSPLLGSVPMPPGWTQPPPHERAVLYGALFGYHPA